MTEPKNKMDKVKQENEIGTSYHSDQWLLDSVKMEEEEKAKILSTKFNGTDGMEIKTQDTNGVGQDKNIASPKFSDEEQIIFSGFRDNNNSCWENVTFSDEVANLCTFKCRQCGKTSNSKHAL